MGKSTNKIWDHQHLGLIIRFWSYFPFFVVKNVFDNFDEKKSPTLLPPSPFLPEFLKKANFLLKSAYLHLQGWNIDFICDVWEAWMQLYVQRLSVIKFRNK